MKAWVVSDIGDYWVSLFHADTAGKAKLRGLEEYNIDEFTDMRARRLPKLDDKPFTYQNAKDAGFEYRTDTSYDSNDEGKLDAKYFVNDCCCEICKNEQRKQIR